MDELVRAAAPGIDRQLVPAGSGRSGQLGRVPCGRSCIRLTSLDRVDTAALAEPVRDAVVATADGRNAAAEG
ncbi:hypothetical protein SAMN04515665_105211 [Blastococcus sp. DSM 46786]|uniref:DUF1801 domain-containing protein n=1 Tax=Blastococcus sp. DSM 46786 TaxID=1798227 RepID=UPI0008D55016|nr:DUF1801 domain-containing protein [Blastococcus sp. DSM 46786]SEK84458.1 hypothetical protein SAMN04515665_105211 [Blastococcus sp. DSM 46786]